MATLTYRNSLIWLAAIDVCKPLTRLTEDLPSQEDHGLIMTIQALMIEVPAMIAIDLIDGSHLRQASLFKLEAAIEVIDNVYPALDTIESRLAVQALIERSFSPEFSEMKVVPTPIVDDEPEGEEPEVPAPDEDDESSTPSAPHYIEVTTDEAQTNPLV